MEITTFTTIRDRAIATTALIALSLCLKEGEKLYLEGGEAKAAALEQANALETDEREGLVRAYLETPLPENWEELSLYERRNYLNGGEFDGKAVGVQQRETVCNMEIWCECFGKAREALKKTDA